MLLFFSEAAHAASKATHGAHHAASPFTQKEGCWLHPLGVALRMCKPYEHGQHHEGNCWVLVAIFVALAIALFVIIASRKMELIPGRLQCALEFIVEGFINFTKGITGERGVKYAPIICSFFLYILCLNAVGLIPGMVSPTANPNVTIALALIAFLLAQAIAIKEAGPVGYLSHLAQDPKSLPKFLWPLVPLFFAIHVIGEIAKPISLSMRLLGNIFGEDTVLVALAGLAAMLGLPSVLQYLPFQFPIQVLAILTSVIQALVFSALLAVYISLGLPHEHHEEHEGHEAHAH